MGCGPSSLAVVELNRTLKAGDGSHMLQDKLQSSPWLLSAATPVLSGTADTPLHTACERKQLEVVQQMLSFLSSATLPVVREALGPYCSRKGRALPISVCEGVSIAVDMVNCKGQTPLMCACAADSPELVKLLLVQGADPWVGDRCGSRTALHYAAMSGSTACIEALMQNIPVRNMARHGIRYINVRSICGLTALHYAVFFDHPSAVEELLSHDPHLNAATISHSYDVLVTCDALSTPMHFAAVRGNAEVVRMMLRQYAQSSSSTANSRSREPRLRVNHGGQLPWQIAATYHPANRDLVALLHPGAPLEQVLGLEGVGERGAGAAYPRLRATPAGLATIAAAALRTRLLSDLQLLKKCRGGGGRGEGGRKVWDRSNLHVPVGEEEDEEEDEAAGAAASSASASSPSPSPSPSSSRPLSQELRPQGAWARAAPGPGCSDSGAGSMDPEGGAGEERVAEGEEGSLCGVCFSEREAVAPAGCGHGVCGQCAERMCHQALGGNRPRPLLCPFCRREVRGFVEVMGLTKGR